ncbi:3-keto-disaccharide hydrolase [Tundrisphaera lichenicola]|uniref:3-keto-disaccharide hydrolase n=1 Tax=Tundrisphaera lichenicola TaxID=2029860 RepID=UPI003EBC8276
MSLRIFGLVAGLSLTFSILPDALAVDEPEAPKGFVALFNGKDLTGWHGMPHFDPRELASMTDDQRADRIARWTEDAGKHWTVEDGELINDGFGPYLTTDQEYGDIELLIDYKTVARADSGIYLRGTPQVQIWDATPGGPDKANGSEKGSGGLFNNSDGTPGRDPLVLADRPFGEWNHLRIIQVGARTTVYLNEKLVVAHASMENYWDRSSPLFARGVIQLQTHGGEIRWRNLFFREIPSDEANKILEASDESGFTSLFDGKSLEDWAGAVENYEVVDGKIRCKTGKGGVLFHKKEFSDFVARVEFKVPSGGNNGLAIRYPGHGNTSSTGMCELQILDDTAEMYAKLDPRQYHGSVYGMVAATRGYLRPVGEWNFQEVTVQGSTIKVELNGTVIVDADVSKVAQFMGGKPHPGKDRTSGFFGFAGHNDPVEFHNVSIKPLN